MKKKEQELFLQLCRHQTPDKKKLKKLLESGYATTEVLGTLFENRMAAIAYDVLEKNELLENVGREFRNALRNAHIANWKWNEDFIGCLRHVSAVLDSADIPYALLKGAVLVGKYPLGCRTSNDIDVLIAPEHVGRVCAVLTQAGFRQGEVKNNTFIPATRQQIIESKMMRGETVPFIKEVKLPFMRYLEVDLNFSLDYKNSDGIMLKKMLERTELVEVGMAKIKSLNRLDFILHLCAHLYKEATTLPWIIMKRDMTFYKYCDIYTRLPRLNHEDSIELCRLAKAYHLEEEFFYCLDSVNAFFGLNHSYLEDALKNYDNTHFGDVIAPAEKKLYRYTEADPVNRFFSSNRKRLLLEVTTV